MALTEITKVTGPGIHTLSNIVSHNINSSGIITATEFDGKFSGTIVGTAATFSGNVTIGGTLTYEDVTNIDSVGIITGKGADINGDLDVDGHTNLDNVSIAGVSTFSDDVTFTTANGNNIYIDKSENSLKLGDSTYAKFGGAGELMMYHDGTYSVIKDINSSPFNFEATGTITFAKAGLTETYAKMIPDGSVELYYNNVKNFETTPLGIKVPDSKRLSAGDNEDLKIYHNGSTNNFIAVSGGQVLTTNSDSLVFKNAANNETYANFTQNGAAELYFNGSKKFETTHMGGVLSGILTATTFDVADKIVHTGDTNTSIRFPTADTITFETAGSERARFTKDGNLFIGRSESQYYPYDSFTNDALFMVCGDLPTINGAGQATILTKAAYNASDRRALLSFGGDYGTNSIGSKTFLAGIGGEKENTTNGNFAGALMLYTRPHGGNETERLRIDSSGRVMIGNTAAASFNSSTNQLVLGNGVGNNGMVIYTGANHSGNLIFNDVADGTFQGGFSYKHGPTGNDNCLKFYVNADERLRIDNAGRMLFGHTSNIAVGGLNPRVQINGTSDSHAHISIRNFSANTTGAILSLAKSRGSVGAYTAVQDDDVLGQINFAGADGTDLAEVAGKITVACDAAVAGNRVPSRMEFHTTDGNGNLDLNMVLTRDGQMFLPQGITRDAMFALAHNSADDFILGRTTGNADTGMTLVSPSATSGFINFADADGQRQGSILYQHGSGADKMYFRTNNNQTGLVIDSGQKVLIGDPSASIYASYGGKLQVSNTNFAMNSFANNQHAQTLLFAKSRATSGSGGSIVGSGDFCGHIEWYADDGVDTQNQIAKISGQMDGTPGANDTPGKLLFYTTADGANASTLRMQITNGGVVHIGSTAVSNTIPTGGLDLQGNNTNCVLEMGNPLPNYSAGRVPTFRITTTDADKKVDLSSMWGGDNGIHKHMTLQGGATIFYNGTNDTEIVRITGSALMVGTTSNSANTQAKGIALNNDGAMISRRDGVMHYYKSIATGGYYANVFMSANTTVGSIFFNSGGTQFNTSSDYRRKENVVSLTDGISKLKQLKPYRFNFKDNPSVTVDGFLAHEAQEIVPHTVTGTKDQVSTSNDVAVGIASTVGEPIYQQMDLSKLVPLLTAALQDEISKREALEARVAALESS